MIRCLSLSIPSRGFWFFEADVAPYYRAARDYLSIPSRGFWFFEDPDTDVTTRVSVFTTFNPLAGILVF